MHLERFAFLIVGVVACGRATPNEPSTAVVTTTAVTLYQPKVSGPAPELPEELAMVQPGCEVDLAHPPSQGDLNTALSFGDHGPVFAKLRGYTAIVPRTVTFPIADTPSQALVTVRDFSSTVWGWSEASDVRVYAGRPALVGETFAPKADASLQWTGRSNDSAIEVSVDLHEVGVSVVGDLACDAASLTPGGAFDPLTALNTYQAGGLVGAIHADHIAASFANATGLSLPPALQQLQSSLVIAQQGDQLRVALPVAEGLLVGWVTRESFVALDKTPERISHDVRRQRCGRGIVGRRDGLLQCSRAVPIVAEVANQRRHIGQSVDVHLVTEGSDWSEVEVEPLAAVPGARILARTQDLAGCRWVGAELGTPLANSRREEGETRCY